MVLKQSAPPVSISKEPSSQLSWLREAVEAYGLRRTLQAYEVREIPQSGVAMLPNKTKLIFLSAQSSADITHDKETTADEAARGPIDHPGDWYEVEEIDPGKL